MSIPLHAAELQYSVRSLSTELQNADYGEIKKYIKKHKPKLYKLIKDAPKYKILKKFPNAELFTRDLAFVEYYLNAQAKLGWRVISVTSDGMVVLERNGSK